MLDDLEAVKLGDLSFHVALIFSLLTESKLANDNFRA